MKTSTKEFLKNLAYEITFWVLLVLGNAILLVVGLVTTLAIMRG